MRKIKILLAGFLLAVLSVLTTGTSANAITDTVGYTFTGGAIDTRMTVSWRSQNDGDGVYFETLHLKTPNGCDKGEGNGSDIYAPVSIRMTNYNGDTLYGGAFTSYAGDGYDCDTDFNVEWRGPDHSGADVHWKVKVRVDNGPDYLLTLGYRVYNASPGFDFKFLYKSVEPCSETTQC